MWYSDKFWTDVTNVECRARWNAKLAREGNKLTDPKCRDIDVSYNQHYRVPAKPKSNVHYCAGTLQAGYATPDSFREYRQGERDRERDRQLEGTTSSQASDDGRSSSSSMFEVTDGAYMFAPSCGYFRIGQLNPMNNNSSQFARCTQHPTADKHYDGYDWRFGHRVKMVLPTRMKRTVSDVQLLKEVGEFRKDWDTAQRVEPPSTPVS